MEAQNELRERLHLLLDASAATRAWRARLATQVALCDLTDQEFLALWLCDDSPAGPRGQGELATALGVSAAQMSGLVERLRQRNLLAVERLGNDRRRQVWKLTAAGTSILATACQSLLAKSGQLCGWLSRAEVDELHGLIQRWQPSDQAFSDAASSDAPSMPDQGGPSSCAA